MDDAGGDFDLGGSVLVPHLWDGPVGVEMGRLIMQLPYTKNCFVCGAHNPHGLGLRFRQVGDEVHADFTPAAQHAGFRDLVHGGIECPVCPQSCGRSTGAAGCKICGGPPARLGIECGIARYSRCGFGDGDVQTNAAGRTGDAACGGRFLTGSNDRRGDEIIRRNSYLVNAANLATSRTMLVLLKKQ